MLFTNFQTKTKTDTFVCQTIKTPDRLATLSGASGAARAANLVVNKSSQTSHSHVNLVLNAS